MHLLSGGAPIWGSCQANHTWALDNGESIVAVAWQTVDALDTRKHWATGHNVSPERLANAVDILHHTDRGDHTALATLATWMDHQNLRPQRPPIEHDLPRIKGLGLDIDF